MMIWLQKQPTNAVESLEEYLTSFSEKEQADYRLIFQKLTRQGWSAETILQGLFAANGQRPDAVNKLARISLLGGRLCLLPTMSLCPEE
ncbi:hypothetical protein K6V67_05420 [Streptococcus suis]|uniref:hypothetical protein n=2 Tax=Streptococcus suis TaxID=1307 RepID=UPI001379B0B1|nr:hypothetical protein [Streptococcus suis]MBY4992310.1 hypothetical protein [Streptococcus suis]